MPFFFFFEKEFCYWEKKSDQPIGLLTCKQNKHNLFALLAIKRYLFEEMCAHVSVFVRKID